MPPERPGRAGGWDAAVALAAADGGRGPGGTDEDAGTGVTEVDLTGGPAGAELAGADALATVAEGSGDCVGTLGELVEAGLRLGPAGAALPKLQADSAAAKRTPAHASLPLIAKRPIFTPTMTTWEGDPVPTEGRRVVGWAGDA